MPVKALIIIPEPVTGALGFEIAISFMSAFVRMRVHFSFSFYDFANSYLNLWLIGILSSISILTGFPI